MVKRRNRHNIYNRYGLCAFLIIVGMTVKGCIGFWSPREIVPEGDFVSFTVPAEGAAETLKITSTDPIITVDWGNGIIKEYTSPMNEFMYVAPNKTVKIYSPSSITKLQVTDAYSFNNLYLCVNIEEFHALFVRMSTLVLPAEWVNIKTIEIEGYPSESGSTPIIIDTHAEWTQIQTMIIYDDGNSVVRLFAYHEWTSMTYLVMVGGALDEQSVTKILVSLDSAGTESGVLDLSGGTSATPGPQGLTAATNLRNKGWSVYTN